MSDRKWYRFGPFRFDGRLLYRGDELLELPEREARVLLMLVERALHLVPKSELLALYGPRADPNNVDQAITRLRKALGDRSDGRPRRHRYIDTVQGDGYVFKVAPTIEHEVCPESVADYYKGLEWWSSRDPHALWKAKECFEAVLLRDPTFARAHAALADCWATIGSHSWAPPATAAAKAKAAAQKALAFDPALAEAHATLGTVHALFERDWARGESDFLRAIELAPEYATAHHRYALLLAATGRLERARAELARAIQLDPLHRTAEVHAATMLYFSRDYEAAEKRCREALAGNLQFWYAHFQLGLILEQRGRAEEAVAEHRRALEVFPATSPIIVAAIARACAVAGNRDEALALLDELQRRDELPGSVYLQIASIHVALGETDAAFEKLELAAERKEMWACFLRVDPRFDSIRDDARFAPLLKRLGLG